MSVPEFTVPLLDREALLHQLQQALQTNRRGAVSPPDRQVTSFGWGLTRLLHEFVNIQRGRGPVARLNAATDVTWHQGLVRTATELNLRGRFLRAPQDAAMGVRNWLRATPDALLVIDDVRDLDRIAEFVAPLNHNRILLALRHPDQVPEGWTEVHRLNRLSEANAAILMSHLSGQRYSNSQVQPLVAALHMNPAALACCGHLLRLGCSFASLEGRFSAALSIHREFDEAVGSAVLKTLREDLQKSTAELERDAWGPFGTSPGLLLSTAVRQQFRKEQLQQPVVERLTALKDVGLNAEQLPPLGQQRIQLDELADALLDRGDIAPPSHEFIAKAISSARSLGAWQRSVELGQRLLPLLKQSSVVSEPSDMFAKTYLAIARGYTDGERFALARRNLRHALSYLSQRDDVAAEALMDIVEIDLNESRIDAAAQRLEQVGKLHSRASISGVDPTRARRLFLRGAVLVARRKFAEATRILQRSLALLTKLFPEDHPKVLQNLSLLTRAAFAKPDLILAEAAVRKDLQIRRESQQVTEGELAVPTHALADLLYSQGQYNDAEKLYEEALELRQKLYLPDDRRVSETLTRLAVLKSTRGAYREADPLFRRCVQLTEALFGDQHPAVAAVLNDLAESLFAQGKFDQARRILNRALRMQETSLRSNDPALSRTRNNLAAIHVAEGHFEVAQQLYEQDLSIKRATLPRLHGWIATTLNNLGEVLRSRGDLDGAEPLLAEALEIRQSLLGPNHPTVAQSLSNLGYVQLLQHRLAAARTSFEQALRIREQTLAELHPHRAASLSCLAQTLMHQGDLESAHAKYVEAQQIALHVYGSEHALTTQLMTRQARVELRLQRRAQAELRLLKAKSLQERTIGSNHRFFGETLLALGEVYQLEGNYEKAFPLLERALAIQRETIQGPRFEIAESLFLTGQNLHARGIHREAHDRLRECYRIWSRLLECDDPALQVCGRLLGELAIQHGDPQQADLLLTATLMQLESRSGVAPGERSELVGLVADARARSGRYCEAEEMLLRQRDAIKEQQGDDSADLIGVYSHQAGVLYLQSRFVDAVPLIEECVRLAKMHHGLKHRETAKHLENLAGVLFLQERYHEAEPLIAQAIDILSSQLGPNAPAVLMAKENYSHLLRRTNRLEEAGSLAEELTAETPSELQSHVLDEIF